MNINIIPSKYKNLYISGLNDYLIVYNPLSKKGITVLNKEAAYLFSLVDGKKNLKKLLQLVKNKDKNATLKDIKSIIDNLVSSDIVYFNKPKLFHFIKKPTHLSVWFHITNQCNLRCTYCYIYKTPDKMSFQIAKKAVKKIISSAKKHGFKNVVFKFAGGEPLLEYKKILNIVNYAKVLAKTNKIDVGFIIITNGVLLNNSICQEIKRNKIRISISLDGLGKYHDQTRKFINGSGTFKYVEKNINKVLTYQIPLYVSITISSKNIENIPALTRYLLKKKISFSFNFFRENSFVNEELEENDKKLIKYLKEAYSIIGKNVPRNLIISDLLDRVFFIKPHLYTCGMGYNYLVVRYDGKIISCQMTQNKVIGSIDDKDLIETVWKGNFIRPRGLTVEGKTPCKNCQWKYICCGGCPLLTYEQKGSYATNSPYCHVYKALIPEVLKIEAKRLIKYGASQRP